MPFMCSIFLIPSHAGGLLWTLPVCQYLLLVRLMLNLSVFLLNHVCSVSQSLRTAALSPTYPLMPPNLLLLLLLTPTILLGVHFVLSCPALWRQFPVLVPTQKPCVGCQLGSQALGILDHFPTCLLVHISSCHWPAGWQDSSGTLSKSLPRASFSTLSPSHIIPWIPACPRRLSNLYISFPLLWMLLHSHRKKWKDVLPSKLKGN